MTLREDHTEAILAPFFGENISSLICSYYPMTVLSHIRSACEGKYALTYVREILVSRNKVTGMIRVTCNKTGKVIYLVFRKKGSNENS